MFEAVTEPCISASPAPTSLPLSSDMYHGDWALIDQIVLQGLERARAGSHHTFHRITAVFLVLDLRTQDTVIMDVHNTIVVRVQALEDCGRGNRGTGYLTELARCVRTIMILWDRVGFMPSRAFLSTL